MKKILILVASFLLVTNVQAQEMKWYEMTLEHPVNFYEVKKEAEAHFDKVGHGHGTGYKVWKQWEYFAETHGIATEGVFADRLLDAQACIHPQADQANPLGNLWQWTSSPYLAYPGYAPPAGALGEYNGKFMCNQFVLRGGSCASSERHIRLTYRNFFPPEARWQFTGVRLAR